MLVFWSRKTCVCVCVALGTCAMVDGDLYAPESPPVISSVPLNSAGAPIHECDMVGASWGIVRVLGIYGEKGKEKGAQKLDGWQ